MDTEFRWVLIWLRMTQKDSTKPPSRRLQAFYILDFYEKHRNEYHSMAQVIAMCRNELYLPQPLPYNPNWKPSNLVSRCAKHIEDTVLNFGAIPIVADFQGHPIKLLSTFPQAIETSFDGETRFELHKSMVLYERLAEFHLARLVKKYGYHYILHAGIREYFMTKLICKHYTFIRMDPRGIEWRRGVQRTFYELLNRDPHIALEELRVAINLSRAFPFDILFLLLSCDEGMYRNHEFIAMMFNVHPKKQAKMEMRNFFISKEGISIF